jgi:hypothetical protein
VERSFSHAICCILQLEPSILFASCVAGTFHFACQLQHLGAGTFDFARYVHIFATLWSWNLPIGMLFASCSFK